MSSDLAEATSATDTAAAAPGEPSSELGPGMAHRARSQSVLGQHWSPSGLVGAVGRASVGFGLAVGRSRAIRPTVRFEDVNSAALRPSFELWRARRESVGEEPPAPEPNVIASSVDRTTAPTVARRIRRNTGERGHVAAHEPRQVPAAERRRIAARAVPRPSWTDQIIQRSSVGFVAPAPGGPMPEPAVPAGFVPSGDAKLDRLRLLVAERDAGSSVDRNVSVDRRESPPGEAIRRTDSAPLRRSTAHQPTVTTHDVSVPGRLARSMRPETVAPGTVPTARVGGGSSLPNTVMQPDRGRAATEASRSATPSGRPGTPTSGGRQGPAGRSSRQAPPDKMERLRAALIERGLLADGAPAGATNVGGADDGGPTIPADPSSPSRTEQVADVVRRAPARAVPADGRASESARPARSPAEQSPPPAPGTAPGLRRTAASPTVPGAESARGSSPVERTGDPSSPVSGGEPTGASVPVAAQGRTRAVELDTAGVEREVAPLGASEPARALRQQRLLRTGLAGSERASFDERRFGDAADGSDVANRAGSPVSAASAEPMLRRSVDASVSAVASTATASTVAASTVTIARPTLDLVRPPMPELVRHGRSESETVIRRVTLPRALSRRHRPPSAFAAPELPIEAAALDGATRSSVRSAVEPVPAAVESVVSRSIGAVPRPSVVTIAQVAASASPADAHRSVSLSETASPSRRSRADLGASDIPLGDADSGAGRFVPSRSRSLVPPGSGALLDVVRRSAATGTIARSPIVRTERPSRTDPPPAEFPRRVPSDEVGTTGPRTSGDTPHGAAVPIAARVVAPPTTSVAGRRDDLWNDADPMDAGGAERTVADQTVVPQAAGDPTADEGRPQVRPSEQVAEQFMTALSETVRRSPAPLPTTFRPMADAIAGPRPVMLSTDQASRRALRSVGKVAATTGDTIHLDERAIPSARLAEVMAHELTHIAHPSPAPRFFDDIDDSPEERRAEQVARVMARSPLAPAASLATPVGRERDRVIRRSPTSNARTSSTHSARPSSPGTVSADQLAAQITGSAPSSPGGGQTDVIRRTAADAPSSAPVIRRTVSSSAEPVSSTVSPSTSTMTPEEFLVHFRDNLSEVMGLIEDRMIIELERRGGRTWGVL